VYAPEALPLGPRREQTAYRCQLTRDGAAPFEAVIRRDAVELDEAAGTFSMRLDGPAVEALERMSEIDLRLASVASQSPDLNVPAFIIADSVLAEERARCYGLGRLWQELQDALTAEDPDPDPDQTGYAVTVQIRTDSEAYDAAGLPRTRRARSDGSLFYEDANVTLTDLRSDPSTTGFKPHWTGRDLFRFLATYAGWTISATFAPWPSSRILLRVGSTEPASASTPLPDAQVETQNGQPALKRRNRDAFAPGYGLRYAGPHPDFESLSAQGERVYGGAPQAAQAAGRGIRVSGGETETPLGGLLELSASLPGFTSPAVATSTITAGTGGEGGYDETVLLGVPVLDGSGVYVIEFEPGATGDALAVIARTSPESSTDFYAAYFASELAQLQRLLGAPLAEVQGRCASAWPFAYAGGLGQPLCGDPSRGVRVAGQPYVFSSLEQDGDADHWRFTAVRPLFVPAADPLDAAYVAATGLRAESESDGDFTRYRLSWRANGGFTRLMPERFRVQFSADSGQTWGYYEAGQEADADPNDFQADAFQLTGETATQVRIKTSGGIPFIPEAGVRFRVREEAGLSAGSTGATSYESAGTWLTIDPNS
ncbi:MAG: hypothetical protein AAGI08_03960, partial [Bacteroidota bacterium]